MYRTASNFQNITYVHPRSYQTTSILNVASNVNSQSIVTRFPYAHSRAPSSLTTIHRMFECQITRLFIVHRFTLPFRRAWSLWSMSFEWSTREVSCVSAPAWFAFIIIYCHRFSVWFETSVSPQQWLPIKWQNWCLHSTPERENWDTSLMITYF